MAIVHQYIIIYITLVTHESISNSFNSDLCLEAAARFISYQRKCYFSSSEAENILQVVTTCPNKCKTQIDYWNGYSHSLRKIDLNIGNWKKMIDVCSPSVHTFDSNLNINCSSWNAGEYITWDDVDDCFINDAQCVRISDYCICHCMPGYNLVDEKCLKKIPELDDSCKFTEQCIQPFSVCYQGKCQCINGYSAFDTESCLKDNVPVGGFCSLDKQCTGSNNSGACEHERCTCAEGFTIIDLACIKRNVELNDSCELTEQCTQPLSFCFQGKCKCINGYSAFDTNICIKDTVPVGGFCNLSKQCTGSNNSGICENGRCICAKEYTSIDLACEKDHPDSLGIGSSNSQQHGTNIGVTLGSLFGGFILGVIVTFVVTTLMYRRLKLRSRKRKEPVVMFAETREYGTAGGAQISFTNNKKQNVAKLSPYSFSKETQRYNLSRKQEDERTEDVYNHLHEQTEQDDDTYDHARVAQNHSTDLSDYSNIRDTATVRPSLSKDGDDYSTLRH